jgi:hypothetical protein
MATAAARVRAKIASCARGSSQRRVKQRSVPLAPKPRRTTLMIRKAKWCQLV